MPDRSHALDWKPGERVIAADHSRMSLRAGIVHNPSFAQGQNVVPVEFDDEPGRIVAVPPQLLGPEPHGPFVEMCKCGHSVDAHAAGECWTYPDATDHPETPCGCWWYEPDPNATEVSRPQEGPQQ